MAARRHHPRLQGASKFRRASRKIGRVSRIGRAARRLNRRASGKASKVREAFGHRRAFGATRLHRAARFRRLEGGLSRISLGEI